MNIGFCVLHFGDVKITQKCLDSIFSYYNDDERVFIVVVDNGMNNTQALTKYNSNRFRIIYSKNNLGFACGNNLGISWLRNEYGCDIVVTLNNDTMIVQNDFVDKVIEIVNKGKWAVVGPKICTPTCPEGDVDNPGINYVYSIEDCKKMKKYYIRMMLIYLVGINKLYFGFSSHFKKGKSNREVKKNTDIPAENVVLHGSALIFTPLFFERFRGFDDRTYMYLEEFILYCMVLRNGLKTYYSPDIRIMHEHQGATKNTYETERKRKLFQYKNLINSIDILEKVIRENP